MTQKEFMSGSELRQYLHISTRKMKYLMDNNYIPHENTGHSTHKYRVRTEDAVRFKARMDTEPGFLSELSGMFSNRTEWHPLPMFEATPENCEAFRLWLDSQWAELPEALPTQTAAELVGHNPQSIHKLIKENVLHGVKIGAVQYIPKTELSPIWLRRKNYPPHAQRNIKNSSKPLNISNAENTKTNSVDAKEK